jgi:HlyD family secretion protein
MSSSPKHKFRRPLPVIAAIAGVIILAGGITAVTLARSGERETVPASLTFAAARGPLTISVSESGTIKARQMEVLKSEIEGQTTILYLVPEGTLVKKGDLLVELDGSRLLDQQVERSIAVQNAEASFERARENFEVVKNQTTADIARARLDAQFAEEDLKNYLEGTFPRDLKELDSRVTMAREEVSRTKQKFEWSERLFAEKYISETELQADRLAAQKAELDLQLANTNFDLLNQFTKPRRVAELTSNVEQTRMALDRVQRRAQADMLQAETDRRVRESEFNRQKSQLERINRQIASAKIYAPADGLVVYATTGQSGGFRGNNEPLAEGQSVRERQELIHLPRTAAMMAEVSVHESAMDKVRIGLPVRITVDALPGRSYTGRIARVAPLPDAQSIWMNPDLKVYRTEIHIDGTPTDLRTGMSCRAEIIVEQIADAVYVPVHTVLRVGGQPTVYVVGQQGQTERRRVELGLDNNRMAHIMTGLNEGDRVLLAPPLADASAPRNEEQFDMPAPVAPVAAAPAGQAPQTDTQATAVPVESAQPEDGEARPRGRRAGGPGGPGRGDGGEGGERGQGRPGGMANMTPEQMQEMRRRFENMTPEEREEARRRFQQGQPENASEER